MGSGYGKNHIVKEHGYVYKMFTRDGKLLYVGSTVNLDIRIRAHLSHHVWSSAIAKVKYAETDDCRDAEAYYINTEDPIMNIRSEHQRSSCTYDLVFLDMVMPERENHIIHLKRNAIGYGYVAHRIAELTVALFEVKRTTYYDIDNLVEKLVEFALEQLKKEKISDDEFIKQSFRY